MYLLTTHLKILMRLQKYYIHIVTAKGTKTM